MKLKQIHLSGIVLASTWVLIFSQLWGSSAQADRSEKETRVSSPRALEVNPFGGFELIPSGGSDPFRPPSRRCCPPSGGWMLGSDLLKGSEEKLRELAGRTRARAPGSDRLQVDLTATGDLDRGDQTLAVIPMPDRSAR